MVSHKHKITRIFVYLYQQFFADDCANRAAALTFTTLLSIVPLFLAVVWILSLFPPFQGAANAWQTFIVSNFVADSANIINQYLNDFALQINHLVWTSLVFFIITAVLMIYNMVEAFNFIWHVKTTRSFALSFLIYLFIFLSIPLLLGLTAVMTSVLAKISFISLLAGTAFTKMLLYFVPIVVTFIIFSFFNWALPSCKVPIRFALIAGLFTTILFELAKYLFVLYLNIFPTYRLLYGALATIPIFLLWLYVSWVIVLLGGIICYVLTHKIGSRLKGQQYHPRAQ